MTQMALALVLCNGIVASFLAGTSHLEQILDNIKTSENTTFAADELVLIEKIVTEE